MEFPTEIFSFPPFLPLSRCEGAKSTWCRSCCSGSAEKQCRFLLGLIQPNTNFSLLYSVVIWHCGTDSDLDYAVGSSTRLALAFNPELKHIKCRLRSARKDTANR